MFTGDHLTEFADLPVTVFDDKTAPEEVRSAPDTVWHVQSSYGSAPFTVVWKRFLEIVDIERLTSLIIGYWGSGYDDDFAPITPMLVEAAPRLAALRSLFVGDIVVEQAETSWIPPVDVGALLEVLPKLETLGVRGTVEMAPVEHARLNWLEVETCGLSADVVRAIGASDLPELEHLDLWLGSEYRGGDATVADLAPLLSGEAHPKLRCLGLGNSEITDELAAALAGASVVPKLAELNLTLGTLTDLGAEALLSGQPLTHLRRLDLSNHFLSEPLMERLKAALPDVDLDLAAPQDFEDREDIINGVWE